MSSEQRVRSSTDMGPAGGHTAMNICRSSMELTCSHIVWFWFWRLASRLHTLAKHPRVTLHLRLYAQRSARYAKPMQKASFWLCEHIAVPCLGNASEMPTKRSVIHSGRLWLTQVKVVKVLSASHIKLRGWRARLLRLPESLPLSSHPAQGQNRKKKLIIWKQLETAIFAARCWTAKRRFGTWLLLLLPDTLATAAWWEFSLSQQNLPPAPVTQGVRSEWTWIYAHYPQVMCTLCMVSRCLKYMESQTCYNLNLLEPLLRQAWAICFGKRKTPPPCRWCHPQLDLACQISRLCKRLAGCAKWKTLNNFE